MSARMKPRCSVWTPRLPPLWAKLDSGIVSVASVSTSRTVALPGGLEAGRVGAMPAAATCGVLLVGEEHLAGVGPERVEGVLHPAVALVGAVAEADRRGRTSARGGRRPPWRPSRRSRRRAGRSRRRAPSGARSGRRRTGTAASACGRSRRSGARRGAGCGSPRRRAGRRGRRPCGPCPRPRRRGRATSASGRSGRARRWRARCPPPAPARGRTTPRRGGRGSASSRRCGAASRRRRPGRRRASGSRSRWLWAAASRASSATSGVFMSGSEGITCAPLRRGCRRRSGGGRPWSWPARRAGPCPTGSTR